MFSISSNIFYHYHPFMRKTAHEKLNFLYIIFKFTQPYSKSCKKTAIRIVFSTKTLDEPKKTIKKPISHMHIQKAPAFGNRRAALILTAFHRCIPPVCSPRTRIISELRRTLLPCTHSLMNPPNQPGGHVSFLFPRRWKCRCLTVCMPSSPQLFTSL